MQPADIAVELRPRSQWEAMDLGLAMLQRWWRQVYTSHAIVLALLATSAFSIGGWLGKPWLALLLVFSMIAACRAAGRRADLVHANWLAGAVIARFSGCPFVVTLHGSGSAGRFSDLALAQRARLRGKGRLRRKPQGTCARSGFDGSARARH